MRHICGPLRIIRLKNQTNKVILENERWTTQSSHSFLSAIEESILIAVKWKELSNSSVCNYSIDNGRSGETPATRVIEDAKYAHPKTTRPQKLQTTRSPGECEASTRYKHYQQSIRRFNTHGKTLDIIVTRISSNRFLMFKT